MDETHALHPDERRVALIKSLQTDNRFYVLVPEERGIRNADTIEEIPDDLLLGIAYPCLEDGLNDFAIIRTTFETLQSFPDEEELRSELMEIVNDARGKLVRRLRELFERLQTGKAHFLGTNMDEFKTFCVDLSVRGCPRRNLDSTMKVNVFESVAVSEGYKPGAEPDYVFEFRNHHEFPRMSGLPPLEFVLEIIGDVLAEALDDDNYLDRYTFDKNVFQKYIGLMFTSYAATDPVFYGIHKSDYGVSEDRDMDSTPLYIAVARELRRIESAQRSDSLETSLDGSARVASGEPEYALDLEDVLLQRITAICSLAHRLHKHPEQEVCDDAHSVLQEASALVQELKRLNVVSPLAEDPSFLDIPF